MLRVCDHNHKLHALCPYFAMFPPKFARDSILEYSKPGDVILDPFSGRGTTLLEALLNGRTAVAGDINPVAYCISAAKASQPSLALVLDELERLEDKYYRASLTLLECSRQRLPAFFRRAFSSETARQLLFLRRRLDWRSNVEHRFIMALLLGHLHGESDRSMNYCSTQMPHSISTKPKYSLDYWRRHDLRPPRRDVFDLLADRAEFRLTDIVPNGRAHVALADARTIGRRFAAFEGRVSAMITSPPYLDTTRFEEDQWLRLWLLGGPPHPTYNKVSRDDRYENPNAYWSFLQDALRGTAPLLKQSAVLVCRLGANGVDPDHLRKSMIRTVSAVWRRARLLGRPQVTTIEKRQTAVLNPESVGCRYEMDFTFSVAT